LIGFPRHPPLMFVLADDGVEDDREKELKLDVKDSIAALLDRDRRAGADPDDTLDKAAAALRRLERRRELTPSIFTEEGLSGERFALELPPNNDYLESV